MKRLLQRHLSWSLLMFALVAFIPKAKAQVTHSENFDSGTFPPVGWTTSGFNSLWVLRNTGTFPTCSPHSAPAMARFSARMQMPGTQDLFVSPVIDFSGNTGSNPTFSLWIFRDSSSTAGDSLTILVNTTNSLTGATRIGAVARSRYFILPTNELVNGWYQYTFTVPSSFNTATNYFLLNGTSQNGANIYIDDLEWVEYPVQCNGTPTVGTISADRDTICGGPGDANLTMTGGTTNQSGISYHWQVGPTDTGPWTDFGNDSPTTNTGSLSSPSYFRCYMECVNSGLADTSATIFIQVFTTPAPVVTINLGQSATYCSGYAPLNLVASGAATYTWTPDIAINNGVGDSALAAPTFNTNYTIVGVDSLGCTGSTTFTVNARQTPNVNATTNKDTICEGQTTNLNAQIVGPGFGIQYQWTPGPINSQNTNVSPTVSTSYVIAATSNQSGCVGRDTILITVIPPAVSAFSYTATNQIVTFTDNSTSATSWLWDFGDGTTSTQQNPIHIYGAVGTYTVTLTVSNGACNNVSTQTVIITQVGLPQLADQTGFLLYPNPVKDAITIEFSSLEHTANVKVLNAIGQVVYSSMINPVNGNEFKSVIDIHELASGIYSLQITTGTENAIHQLIKN